MRLSAPALLLLAFLASASSGAAPSLFNRSNAVGLVLEPLSRFDPAEPYLLRIEQEQEREVRTLFRSGKEWERREIEPLQERVYAQGVLSEERHWDARGRLTAELVFTGGVLELRREFLYGPSGLTAVESYDAKGALLSRDDFELNRRGELRRVRRQEAEGPGGQQLALVSAEGRLFEQRLAGGGRLLGSRYDAAGRLSSQESWREQALVETRVYAYEGQALRPATEERVETDTGRRTLLRYDAEGRESGRVVSQGGKILEEWSLAYDERGNLARSVRSSEAGRQEWTREHDGEGRLLREEYRLRGQLEKVTRFPEEKIRVEELFRAGGLLLVVTYRSGVRVREEFVQDGAVVRTREYPEAP